LRFAATGERETGERRKLKEEGIAAKLAVNYIPETPVRPMFLRLV